NRDSPISHFDPRAFGLSMYSLTRRITTDGTYPSEITPNAIAYSIGAGRDLRSFGALSRFHSALADAGCFPGPPLTFFALGRYYCEPLARDSNDLALPERNPPISARILLFWLHLVPGRPGFALVFDRLSRPLLYD